MQADLLNLEERVGSGRLPMHIFLLESLSSPRDQVLKYFKRRSLLDLVSFSDQQEQGPGREGLRGGDGLASKPRSFGLSWLRLGSVG